MVTSIKREENHFPHQIEKQVVNCTIPEQLGTANYPHRVQTQLRCYHVMIETNTHTQEVQTL